MIPVGSILNFGSTLLDKLYQDKDEREKAKLALLQLEQQGGLQELEVKLQPLISELSGNWLQRSWRPILMLSFTYIIVHNYIIVPIFSIPAADIPPDMWQLLKLGVGGYVLGRSGEKIAEKIKK
jgi:hypothetical protein